MPTPLRWEKARYLPLRSIFVVAGVETFTIRPELLRRSWSSKRFVSRKCAS